MDNSPPSLEDSKVLQIIGQIMISSVITLFIVITVIFFIHIYTKWHWSRSNTEDPSIVAWRRRQFALMTTGNDINGPPTTGRANQQGLDSKVLESLPVIVYNAKDDLECAVCLSEIEEGEKTRLLPSCNHRFHDGCIDMWFQSHSTCPLCRNPVMVATDGRSDSIRIQIDENLRSHDESLPSSSSSLLGGNDDGSGPHGTAGVSTQSSSFPANTQQLLRGNQTQVSSLGSSTEGGQEHDVAAAAGSSVSSHGNEDVVRGGSDGGKGKGSLVIDIPKRLLPTANRSSPSLMGMIASNHHDGDEMKSPAATPASTRSETLKRLLSGGKTALHSACSSTSSSSESATSGVHHQVQQV